MNDDTNPTAANTPPEVVQSVKDLRAKRGTMKPADISNVSVSRPGRKGRRRRAWK